MLTKQEWDDIGSLHSVWVLEHIREHFNTENNLGRGFLVGRETDEIEQAIERDNLKLRYSFREGYYLCQDSQDDWIIVADDNGPWGIKVKYREEGEPGQTTG